MVGILGRDAEHGFLSYFPSPLSLSYNRLNVTSYLSSISLLPKTAMAAQNTSSRQKRSEKNPDSSLIGPQWEDFSFMKFQNFKAEKDPVHMIDVFTCKFKEKKCLARSCQVQNHGLEHGPPRKGSACFAV